MKKIIAIGYLFNKCSPALLRVLAALFGMLTLLIAVFGKKSIFYCQLSDVLILELTIVLCMEVGICIIAGSGYWFSSRKAAILEKKLSAVKQTLKEKEELLHKLQRATPRFRWRIPPSAFLAKHHS